jgi:AcrR family transcriptional regulator
MARVPAEQRRRDFVEAAVRVIAEHGVPDATTRRIAEAAGAPLASLHYCFASKEELFAAVFETQAFELHRWDDGAGTGTNLASAAMTVLERAVGWFRDHPDWASTQMELFFWALRHDDGALAERSFTLHLERISHYLRASLARTDDPAMVEPAARMVAALSDGIVLQWLAYGDDDQLQDSTKRACESLGMFLERPSRRRH